MPYDKIPFVLDEIHRVLIPSGVFRLSIPDYRSPLLSKQSIYDSKSHVVCGLTTGATAFYDSKSGEAKVRFKEDGKAHVWFPKYELILDLMMRSNIRNSEKIFFYQYFFDDAQFRVDPIPENEMFVIRSVPNDPGKTLYFKTVQVCDKGEHRWIEIPEGGKKWGEYKEPAPFVQISGAP